MSEILHDPYKPVTIKVSCMKCGKPTKVNVPYDFDLSKDRRPRKWCPLCKAGIEKTESYFDSNYSDGCRQVAKR